jgi:YrbI family 3-deoxy-D-manno-octulosonate 8-phosphate phosphatase
LEGSFIRDNLVLKKKISKTKLLLVNCDGVLTDGSFYLMESGEEARKFSTKDFLGIKLMIERNELDIYLTSTEKSIYFLKLAKKLNLSENYLGIENKESAIESLMDEYQIGPEQIAYIGYEIDDLNLMCRVGLSICPLDAAYEVIQKADYVCNSCGGNGVLREVADIFILTSTSANAS